MKGFGKNQKSFDKKGIKKILSKKEIINHAFRFHAEGNFSEASKYYRYFMEQGYSDHIVFSNYGDILKNNGKLYLDKKHSHKHRLHDKSYWVTEGKDAVDSVNTFRQLMVNL